MIRGYRVLPERFNSSVDPHRQLWCSVLLQAIEDARGKAGSTVGECLEARNWLTEPENKWRSTVCDHAGIREECLLKMTRGLYA